MIEKIKTPIFVDSDGVIADMSGYCLEKFGKRPEDYVKKSEFWQKVQYSNDKVEPFFRSLPKMEDADELIDFLLAHFETVKILTASGYTPKEGPQQKRDWYSEHYPDIECIVVPKSPDKAKYAVIDGRTTVLIDDRMKSIDPWTSAGGTGILHTSAADTIDQLRLIFNISK
jgi:5'(3')-deoxyribonucleotidase